MSRLGAYLPQDRLRSLVTGEPLSARTQGSALFADISGFTVLTEELTRRHGPRKGVDELSRLLDRVYGALIERVEAYGGVIISFAGDSILVWFEGDASAASLAVACAHSMAEAMREFSGLSLRTSITTGAARRLVVGDPTIQHIDTLAGRTIARLATGERLAERGEILLDASTREALGAQVRVEGERVDEASGERFYCSGGLTMPVSPRPLSPMEEASVPPEKLRSWLLPTVFEREMRGLSSFLTELRPVAPVFIRFTDLDYDNDEDAAHKLNAFIVHVQRVVSQQDGSLLQLVIGDKGCYVYAVFGAPTAHEDDTLRALHASVELAQTPHVLDFIPSVQIGVSLGTMRVGAYGSASRRTYSALGDEVNLAARLMTIADPGEILVTGRVQKAVAGIFDLQPHEAITVKGKQEPQPVFSITGLSRQRATRLPEPNYRLPMIGRQEELALVDEKLNLALQGKGQVIGIEADAGMGKSRLVAEIIRLARKRGFVGYGGACQSSGMNTPYLVWQAIWQAFFDLDPEMPQRKQMRLLEVTIEDLAPERVESLPLLGLALDLPLPANDFTTALDPKDRKNALEALLEDCLRSEAKESPLLFVLEDLHWVDPASSDLLATLARVSADLPVCFVLAYRPPDVGRRVALSHETLPYFTRIALTDLSAAEASQLIRSKLAQLFPERGGPLPAALVQELTSRSQGNPFFIEELLNYLHDRGLNPYDENALTALELPASLQTLILSRMDQLSEQQKVTLKVASVIGRVFPFLWLHGYYPSLGEEENIKRNLLELSRLELTPLDTPEPELSYLFKHIITQEVAYESLSYNTRAQLHEKLAQYIEESYPEDLPLNVLAYHYSRSDNLAKKREYLRRSGEAAQAVYSNAAALDYYAQALASSPSPSEAIDLHLKMGTILHIVSEWDAARLHFDQALEIASAQGMEQQIVQSRLKLGALLTSRAEYRQAVEWLQATHALAERIHEEARAAEALAEIGTVYWRMGESALARPILQQSIELAHRLGDNRTEGIARLALASLKAEQGEYAESHKDFDIALALARASSDKRRVASVLLNSGTTYYYEGKYDIARERISQCLAAVREIGDKRFTSIALNNLGNIYFIEGDYQTAGKYYAEALAMARSISDRYTMAISLSSSGITAFQQGDLALAETCYNESLSLNRELGDKLSISLVYCYLGLLALARDQFNMARSHFHEGLTVSFGINAKSYVIYNLVGFGCLFHAEGRLPIAAQTLSSAAALAATIGFKLETEIDEPYQRTLTSLKADLSEQRFASAWEVGQAIGLDEAVDLALNG